MANDTDPHQAGGDAGAAKAGAPGGDSPKPHGDKLGVGSADPITASPTGATGDSPKRQGDKLEHAAREAAKG
jgi:hypothetical protein